MKKFFSAAVFVFAFPVAAFAYDCSSPPTGFGGDWSREYQAWCESCCGTFSSSGPSCNPGPNWGCGGGASQVGADQPYFDPLAGEIQKKEAERQKHEEEDRLRREREAAERAKQEDFERKRDDTLKGMKGIAENDLGLKGLSSGEPRLRELDTPNPPVSLKPAPNATSDALPQDKKLMDRLKGAIKEWKEEFSGKKLPPDFPALEEVKDSPGSEAWRRGMDAVVAQDWQLALAWFKTAKQKDPLNAAIGRAVELAEWTWEYRKKAALQASKPSAPPANPAIQLPQNKDLELLFFPAPTAAPAPEGNALQLPQDSDLEFLFTPDEMEEEILELLFPGRKRRAMARIDPAWADPQVSAAVRTAYADELAAQAVLLVDKKDYEGAIALLTVADRQAPHIMNYSQTIRLIRDWMEKKKGR